MGSIWDSNWVHESQKPDKLEHVNTQIKLRAQYEIKLLLKLFTKQMLEQKKNEINNSIQMLERKINEINNSIQMLERKINEANYSIRTEIGWVSSNNNKKIKHIVKIKDIKPIFEQIVKKHACESNLSEEQQQTLLQKIKNVFGLGYAQKLMQKRAELEQKLVGTSISDETYKTSQKNNKEFLQYLSSALDYLKVQQNGMALKDVKEELITKELCVIAVQQNGMALQFVPIRYKNVDLCVIAVQQNSDAGQYVPTNIQSTKKFNRSAYLGR